MTPEELEALKYDPLAGYSEYVAYTQGIHRQMIQAGHRQPGSAPGIMQEWQWALHPQYKRKQLMTALPIELLEKDEGGRPIVPRNYVLEKGAEAAYSSEALLASHLGVAPGGVVTTFMEKFAKRTHMLGQHEQAFLSPFPGPELPTGPGWVKPGPGATGPDVFQVLRGALLIGADPLHGSGWLERGMGSVYKPTQKEVWGEFTPTEVGTTFRPGSKVVLGEGLAGYANPHWYQKITGVTPITRETETGTQAGYRFDILRSRPVDEMVAKMAFGSTKATMGAYDLSGVTGVYGQPLGLQFIAPLKDIGGAAYEHFIAQGFGGPGAQAQIARELGYGSVAEMPRSYGELEEKARSRFSGLMGSMVQTIGMPMRVHAEMLERFRPVMAGEPTPVAGYPDLFDITAQYQAIVGDFAKQLMVEYDVNRPWLNPTEWERFKRQRPEAAARAYRYGRPIQSAYRSVINATLATSYGWQPKGPTIEASEIKEEMRAAMLSAEAGVRTPAGEIDYRKAEHLFFQKMRSVAPSRLIHWGSGIYTPSFGRMGMMGARGLFAGEEVSRYLTSVFGAAREAVTETGVVSPGPLAAMAKQQRVVAESPQALRRAMGMFLPPDLATGMKVLTHPGLAPNEVYVPGREGLVNILGFPTTGEGVYSEERQVTAISKSRAEAIGLSSGRMYASEDIHQMLQRDTDGDIEDVLQAGLVTKLPDGTFVSAEGTPMSRGEVKRLGQLAVKRGAANLREDHPGYDPRADAFTAAPTSLEQARQSVIERLAGARTIPWEGVSTETEAHRRLGEQIGPYHNAYDALFATATDPEAGGALQATFNVSHGFAQRPKAAPAEVQAQRNVLFGTVRGGGFDLTQISEPGGGATMISAAKGAAGYWNAAALNLHSLVRGGYLSPREAAALSAPLDVRDQAEQMYGIGDPREFAGEFGALVSAETGVRETTIGRGYARAIKKAFDWAEKEGKDPFAYLASGEGGGHSRETVERMLALGEKQRDYITAVSKFTGQHGLAARAQAAISARGQGWLGTPPQPSPGEARAAQVETQEKTAAAAGMTPEQIAKVRAGAQRIIKPMKLASGEEVLPRSKYVTPSGLSAARNREAAGVLENMVRWGLWKGGVDMPGTGRMEAGKSIHTEIQGEMGLTPAGEPYLDSEKFEELYGVPIRGRLDAVLEKPGGLAVNIKAAPVEKYIGLEFSPEAQKARAEAIFEHSLRYDVAQITAESHATGRPSAFIAYPNELVGNKPDKEIAEITKRETEKWGMAVVPEKELLSHEQMRTLVDQAMIWQEQLAPLAAEMAEKIGLGEMQMPADWESVIAGSGGGRQPPRDRRIRVPAAPPPPPDDRTPKVPLPGGETPGSSAPVSRVQQNIQWQSSMAPLGRWDIARLRDINAIYGELSPTLQAMAVTEGGLTPAQAGVLSRARSIVKEGARIARRPEPIGGIPGVTAEDVTSAKQQFDVAFMQFSGTREKPGISAGLEERALGGMIEKAGRSTIAQLAAPEVEAAVKKLLSGVGLLEKDFADAHAVWKTLGGPEFKDMHRQYGDAMKGLIKQIEEHRPWAGRVLAGETARGVLSRLETLEPRQWGTQETKQFRELVELERTGRAPGAEPGPIAGRLTALQARMEEAQAMQVLAPEDLPRGRRVLTAAEQFYNELSFGGAYFKLMAAQRLFGRPVNQWQEAARGYAQAQLGFAVEMGAGPSAIMATPMGQIAAGQAIASSFQMGMGEAGLTAQAGFANILAGAVGGGSPYAAGQAIGAFATPAFRGAQTGLTAGVIAAGLGRLAPALGADAAALAAGTAPFLGRVAAGIGAAAGPIGLAVGGIAAVATLAAYTYQRGDAANVYRSIMEGEQRRGQATTRPEMIERMDLWAEAGVGMRMLTHGSDYKGKVLGGYEAFRESPQYQIARATLYVEKMEIPGLDQAQKAQVAGYLSLGGVTPEMITAGGADRWMRQMAPLAMTGILESTTQRALQLSQNLGITPGAGFRPYSEYIATLAPVEQEQAVRAGGILGGIGARVGMTPSLQQLQQYQQALGAGTPEWKLQLQAQQQYGMLPIAQAAGFPLGSAAARWFSGLLTPGSQAEAEAQSAAYQSMSEYADIMGLSQEERARLAAERVAVMGGRETITWERPRQTLHDPRTSYFEEEAPDYAQVVRQYIPEITQEDLARRDARRAGALGIASQYGLVSGTTGAKIFEQTAVPLEYPAWTEAEIGRTAAKIGAPIAAELGRRPGAMKIQELADAMLRGGEYSSYVQSYIRATKGLAGNELLYGIAPGTPAAERLDIPIASMLWAGATQGETQQFQQARQLASQVWQATGGAVTGKLEQAFYGALASGVPSQNIGIVAQQMIGQGALAQAFGAPAGFAWEPSWQARMQAGQINSIQYQQATSAAQFGMGRLGASIMAGLEGFGGLGAGLSEFFDAEAAKGVGPGAYTGRSLYERGPEGGIYGRNTIALRDLWWEQQAATKAYTRGMWGLEDYYKKAAPTMLDSGQTIYGFRGIEDAMTAENRRYQFGQIAMGERRAAVGYRQSLESLGLQQAMWSTNIAYNRQESAIGWEQMQQRQTWQRQDFAFDRQVSGFQYGYQMDELNRSIRLSTGRQRQQLLRQREYAEEMYSMQETRRGTTENRAEEQMRWEEERFQRERSHFEEVTGLQAEQFEMQKRHLAENFALQMEQYGAQRKHLETMNELEDAQRVLQREYEDESTKRQRAYQEAVWDFEERRKKLLQDAEDAEADYLEFQATAYSPGGQVHNAFMSFINTIKAELGGGGGSGGGGDDNDADKYSNKVELVVDGHSFTAFLQRSVDRMAATRAASGGW